MIRAPRSISARIAQAGMLTIPFLLITWAERTVGSALAAVLTSLVPLFVVVLAPLFIHDEPLRLNAIAGLAVGFIGVIVLTSPELSGSGSSLVSVLALVGSSASYAAGAVYSRRNVRGVDPLIPRCSRSRSRSSSPARSRSWSSIR